MLLLAALIASSVPAADEAAIFTAAGFKKTAGSWRTACDEGGGEYTPGAIEIYRDLNSDGRPEALVTEGGSYCYGQAEAGFFLLTKSSEGRWKKLYDSPGIAELLKTSGAGKMPDISVGGPGFCFPVVRWNGKAYVQNRFEYEGKACRPQQ